MRDDESLSGKIFRSCDAQVIRRSVKKLKKEIINLEDTDNWDIIILPLIDKIFGKDLI